MNDDGYTRITLRMPSELHAKLTAEASRTSKSMNAEIVSRLESSFERPTASVRDNAGELRKILNRLDQQRLELEGTRHKLFSTTFEGLINKYLAEGLEPTDAIQRASREAHAVAYAP